MKRVLFNTESVQQLHTLWKSFIYYPPKGYVYHDITGKQIRPQTINSNGNSLTNIKSSIKKRHLIEFVNRHFFKNVYMNYFVKRYVAKNMTNKINVLNPDIVYCINGSFIHCDKPWIIDVEQVGVFTFLYNYKALGNRIYRSYIEKLLSSENCKKILPYSKTAKKSILANLNCGKFIDKIKIAPNVVRYKKDITKIQDDTFNILFVGSINNPDEFYNRGGREVIFCFLKLIKKIPDLKLIIKAIIPNKYKKLLRKHNNFEIYENLCDFCANYSCNYKRLIQLKKVSPLTFCFSSIKSPKFDDLFLRSDVYFLPAYTGYAMSILDGLNFSLPIITTDFLENGEYVINDYNGFKINLRNKPRFYLPHIPIHITEKTIPPLSKEFIKENCEKIQYLYENKSEKIKMGRNSRKLLKNKYSLEKKNQILKKIYDKI
ncbi:MAG: hypothetical protein ACFFDN_12235 [Candidatus Hodarchaeota archaeon]